MSGEVNSDMRTHQQQQHHIGEEKFYKANKYMAGKTRLICGGLIGIGVVILQAFISSGVFPPSPSPTSVKATGAAVLDIPALIAVIALALALPLLSVLLIATFEETSRRFIIKDTLGLQIAYWFGIVVALIGIAAAFWHISLIAGVLVSLSMIIGVIIYTGYAKELYRLDKLLKEKRLENIEVEENEFF